MVDGTSYVNILEDQFAWFTIVLLDSIEDVYDEYVNGGCDLIAGDQFSISPRFLENRDVDVAYTTGTKLFSKEPLSLVTRENETAFSDVVNWIINSLVWSEERNIAQADAGQLDLTGVIGQLIPDAIENAVAAVGNFAEIYGRHLDAIRPRQRVNLLNDGTTGRIYSQPVGNLATVGPGAPEKVIDIRRRERLNCGIRRRPYFADFDEAEKSWVGIDVEFCNAIAGSLFSGQFSGAVEYIDLADGDAFESLADGTIDLLSGGFAVSPELDFMEPSTGLGFTFSSPIYYDGLAFGGKSP